MGKKLNVAAVNSAAKKAYTMKKCHVTDNQGEIWDVDVDVYMNPSKVINMVQNVVKMSAVIASENIESFDMEKHWMILYFIEVLKNYTSLEINEKETVEETLFAYVTLFNSLSSLGLIEKITECFDIEARNGTAQKFREELIEMTNFINEETNKFKVMAEEVTAEEPTEEVE